MIKKYTFCQGFVKVGFEVGLQFSGVTLNNPFNTYFNDFNGANKAHGAWNTKLDYHRNM